MAKYLYETHLHTIQASKCGKVRGADYIEYMKAKGYSGIFVTDHFFNGNSAVPKYFPWKQKVELYVSGYKDAFNAAKDKDFDVIFGIEFNFNGDEYLIYGVDEKWLLENDDILRLSRSEVYTRVHQGGGVMIQAHPYRERYYLSEINLTPSICDGIEIYNAANPDNQNARGYRYATELGLPMTAGSDLHFFHDNALGGMLFDHRLDSAKDYIDSVMNGEGTPVRVFEGNITPVLEIPELLNPTDEATLPVIRR